MQHKRRRKSVLLLAGTAGFRARAAKLVVVQDDRVLAWARRHCREAVVTVGRLSKPVGNARCKATGALSTGARLEPASESSHVR